MLLHLHIKFPDISGIHVHFAVLHPKFPVFFLNYAYNEFTTTQIARYMGPTWVLLSPRCAPCCPHEPCYQGTSPLIRNYFTAHSQLLYYNLAMTAHLVCSYFATASQLVRHYCATSAPLLRNSFAALSWHTITSPLLHRSFASALPLLCSYFTASSQLAITSPLMRSYFTTHSPLPHLHLICMWNLLHCFLTAN